MQYQLDPEKVPEIGNFKQLQFLAIKRDLFSNKAYIVKPEEETPEQPKRIVVTKEELDKLAIKKKAEEFKKSGVWTPERVRFILETNPTAVLRGVVALYKFQTAQEQNADRTLAENGVGFNAYDSEFLSSIAKLVMAKKELTDKQFKTTQKKLYKYTRQLTEIAIRNTKK